MAGGAAENESFLEMDHGKQKIMSGLVKLQGHIRGMLIRKALHDIQKTYEEIVADIEEDLTVRWPPNSLGMPSLRKKTNKSHASLNKDKNMKEYVENSSMLPEGQNNHFCISTEENHSRTCPKHCCASSFKNRICICNCNRPTEFFDVLDVEVQATRMDKKSMCDGSFNQSSRALDLPKMVSQACQVNNQNCLAGPVEEVSTSDSCVSREVQTDFMKGVVNLSTDNVRTVSEKHTDDVSVQNNLQDISETMQFVRTEVPSLPCERANTKEANQNDKEFQFSDVEKVSVSVASCSIMTDNEVKSSPSSDAGINTGNKDQAVTASNGCDGQFPDNTDSYISKEVPITVKDDVGGDRNADLNEDDRQSQFDLPGDKDKLVKLKSTLAMELLWIEQAINSRKNYLRLKQQLA